MRYDIRHEATRIDDEPRNIVPDTYRVRPRNGLVLIRREARKETTDSGVVIPGGAGGEFDLAYIVAVGPGNPDFGHRIDTSDLKPGQRVFIRSQMKQTRPGQIPGTMSVRSQPMTLPFKVDGEEVELINQSDIFAIVD